MTSSLFESYLSLFLLCAQHNHLVLLLPSRRSERRAKRSQSHFRQCLRSLCRGFQGKGVKRSRLCLRSSQSRPVAHCRGFQGKDAVKRSGCVNPATSNVCALYAEDYKGKALSEAMQIEIFASRSSQSRLNGYILPSRRSERRA